MGVPKFYRWISERYPCLSEVVKEYQVPEFDNLYLDMNGIIHVCSHPNDDDPHFRITEEQIFRDVFHYIEVIFRIVLPKKVFFMAVDGVAPRAKMNQQRGRRFRSAKEAEENIKKALQKGEMLPEEKRFDSNSITPGTKFMVRLQEQLEYMVKSKITSDPAWQGKRIYLSGHETPGEGEHKITEFIRHERMQPGYDSNTRHCLYGLDADLMMLGLCSHEPHFSLLREEVRFTGKKKQAARTPKPEETTFHLLHLSLMREYIDHEFEALKKTLPFKYDLEAVIDDWVLMGFLVGNDFIPHLPNLHIAQNALPMIYQTYIQVLPTLDGYLNESGVVNLARFEKYLEVLFKFDVDKFEEVYADFKWMESKVGKKKKQKNPRKSKRKASKEVDSLGSREDEPSGASGASTSNEQKAIGVVKDSEIESIGSQDDTSTYDLEFKLFKRNYYQEKLHFEGTEAEVANIAYEYILAIQWICHYYYNGVQSWSWYYPFHYAPYLSDLRNLSKMKLRYDMDVPFLPYEQLLAVLPSGSKECLPESFWELMCSETSPIIDYYPLDFTCDLNGKQQEWEAVVLIPFINEDRLLTAMQPCLKKLNKADKERNKHSGCQLHTYDSNLDFYVESALTETFPNITHCKSKIEIIPLHFWSKADISSFVKGLLPGCRLSVYYPGFPTLYHLPHRATFKKQGVKVFQMPSRSENMILAILLPEGVTEGESGSQPYRRGDTLDDVAKNLLGTSIYVNWPHMEEAKVVAISDEDVKFQVTEHTDGGKGSKHKMQRRTLSKEEQQTFWQDNDALAETYLNRRGVDIGETNFLVYAQPLLGRKYVCGPQGEITLEKQWATKPRAYALQATVKDISVKDPTFQQFTSVEELLPCGSNVFMLGQPYYGCQGKVLQVANGMTSIEFSTPCEPAIDDVIKQRHRLSAAYYPGWELGSRLGISNYLVSRITGTIFVFYPSNQKWQVGLSLRFTKESSGIAGYTKLHNGEWRYSEAVERTLTEYMEKFPEVLTYLQTALQKKENEFDAAKMVARGQESAVKERLKELSTWLKSLDCYHGDKVNEYSDMLEPKVVAAVLEKVEECRGKQPSKPVEITLRPHVLYRPLAHQGTLIPDKGAQHRLLDRIVNVRDGYTVPLGMRGTIIGIHKQPGQDVLYDVVFDEEFLGGLEFGGRCPKRRGYRMPECALINLSHGHRIGNKDHKPMAVVRPQNKQSSSSRQTWRHQPQPQFQRVHSPSHRDRSPRHAKPAFQSRQQPREFHQRSHSVQWQAPRHPTIMQRPASNPSGSLSTTKPPALNQGSRGNMFDTLWNTLKEHNKKPVPEPSTWAGGHAFKPRQKTSSDSKSVPTVSAPKPSAKARTAKESPRKEHGSTSLAQAAKSLPMVKPSVQAAEDKEGDASATSPVPETYAGTATTVASVTSISATQQKKRPQQTSTKPTNTVTQSKPNSGGSGAEHLNNLFKSLKPPKSHPGSPRLAFTPTQPLPHNHYPGSTANDPTPPGAASMYFDPFYPPYNSSNSRFPSPNQPHPIFNRLPYGHNQLANQPVQNMPRYPGAFNNRLSTRGPTMFPPPAFSNSQGGDSERPPFIPLQVARKASKAPEGAQQLCEMLNSENEDASSSKWSKREEDDEIAKKNTPEKTENEKDAKTEDTAKKFDDLSVKDEVSDGDSVKDEEDYMERSTSVDDENPAILKQQTKLDELLSLCTKCGMLPPIYTYFTTGDEKVVSTVQLWNGVRFSSHSQISRDKAMEEAAGHALSYLKGELRGNRPVSTSPPVTLPYYLPVQNLVQPQYYAHAHQAAYAARVPYAPASAQPYFIPSVPYTMLPPAPVVTIASDYQQAAIIHPQYRFNPQYAPYVQQYPYVQLQASPTRQLKDVSMYHHGFSAKPVWTNYPKDSYAVQDKANSPRHTEYKLLDGPPRASPPKMEEQHEYLRTKESITPKKNIEKAREERKPDKVAVTTQKRQGPIKPKLAISFKKD